LQEKAIMNPPPPGAAAGLVEIVMIVPAAELLPAVAVQVEPAAASVEQLIMEEPCVQTVLLVDGVTLHKLQFVLAPE
jgi:hypothetical protein